MENKERNAPIEELNDEILESVSGGEIELPAETIACECTAEEAEGALNVGALMIG